MIYVTIKTKRVYGHGTDGMPKFEVIDITLEDGAQLTKFLKYLPYKQYITDDLRIVKVVSGGKEIDKSKWENILEKAISAQPKPISKLDEAEKHLKEEKLRNDELLKRIEALENKGTVDEIKQIGTPKIGTPVVLMEELTEMYIAKFGRKPHYKWDEERLKEKLKD